MWLVTGPFDSDGEISTKTKLLKTGRKIPLGRKDRPLLVNNKKISRDHCEFTVGPCTEDDVLDPSFVPALELYNAKDRPMSIDREGEPVVVNPESSQGLKSGDKINIVAGVSLQVNWRRVACFLPPARALSSISNADCAAMGVHLISSPSALATHHLTPKYELTLPLGASLLSATQLVKAEWLQELIRLGTAVDENHPFKLTPLEQSFTPPPESKYRPVFSSSLPSSLKTFKFWEPNEERLHLLKGYRFVILSDTEGQVDADARELAIRGGGEYECFPLANGEAKWRQLLAKAKRKVDEAGLKVVIVARELAVQAAVGADRWREMTAEAESLSLSLISPNAMINAVIHTDVSLLHADSFSQGAPAESESPLPDIIPNTHPSEPSLPVAQEKPPEEPQEVVPKSRSSSPPAMLYGLPIPPPPSRSLLRRGKPPSMANRAEEPAVPVTKDETQGELGYTLPPLPARPPSSRLKRTRAPTPSIEERVVGNKPEEEEPPHKKFKDLFDATNPDKMVVDPAYDNTEASVGMTQSGESHTQTCDSRSLAPARALAVVPEEEEESVPSQAARHAPPTQGPPLQSHATAPQDPGKSVKPPSKQAKAKTTSDHMDTDPAFLTALASRKGRKKQSEDEFDRDFNKLRIARPELHREKEGGEDDRAWEVLGDFDTDTQAMRGNFMVIVEMDVFERAVASVGMTRTSTRTYDGQPNFKKFKKVPTPSSRAPIELVARGEQDYGVGSGYWKGTVVASGSQDTLGGATQVATQKRRAPTVLESDGADSDVPPVKPVRKTTARKKATVPDKLFLNSDDEPVADVEPQAKAQAPGRKLPARGSKRRHIVVEDDDSDDGLAFKGFGKKRRL